MVNMTGPCFELDMRVTCRFNTRDSEGVVIDENREEDTQLKMKSDWWTLLPIRIPKLSYYPKILSGKPCRNTSVKVTRVSKLQLVLSLVSYSQPNDNLNWGLKSILNYPSEEETLWNNRATCIMPWTEAEGWVDFEISLNGGPFYWKGRIYVEPPNVIYPINPLKVSTLVIGYCDYLGTTRPNNSPKEILCHKAITLQ